MFTAVYVLACGCIILAISQVNGATFEHSHDPLSRLTNAAYSDGSAESYAYDDAGNRLSRVTLAATTKVDNTPPSRSQQKCDLFLRKSQAFSIR
jgi:YD repeat-containing protein